MWSLTILDIVLAGGVAVVANLALRVIVLRDLADRTRRAAIVAAPFCAVAASVSIFAARSWWSTALVVPWLCLTLAVFVGTAWSEVRLFPRLRWVGVINGVACAYLGVSATFLLLWRIGAHPSDLSDTIVQLTAIHYLFAGFAALALTSRCVAAARRRWSLALARAAAALIMVASPVIAIGFVVDVHFLAVGAVVMVTGIVGIAAVNGLDVAPNLRSGTARNLLRLSSASVLISMALALDYGLGQVFSIATPTIDEMALTHGLINAVLFAGCGLVAWMLSPNG